MQQTEIHQQWNWSICIRSSFSLSLSFPWIPHHTLQWPADNKCMCIVQCMHKLSIFWNVTKRNIHLRLNNIKWGFYAISSMKCKFLARKVWCPFMHIYICRSLYAFHSIHSFLKFNYWRSKNRARYVFCICVCVHAW